MKSDNNDKIKPSYKEKDINLTDDLCSENSSISKIYNKDVYIYSWGKNKYGELGLNTAKNTFIPSPIKSLKLSVIKSVKSGGRVSIILTNDGKVLSCGSNIFNLLAITSKYLNNEQYQKTFKPLKLFEENNEIIKEIAVAEFHSLALNNNGEVYGWGGNLFNKLGQTNGLCGLPSKIYLKRKIISIACGDYHSCALSENGVLYSWGGGGESYNKGQCGHGSKKDIEHPKKVEFFTKKGLHITKVSCGGYHTIVMDEKNQLYGFGKGIFGQCGYGQPEDTDTPKKIIFNDKNINKILDFKCGGEHSIFLSNNGRVYTCGHGYFGQLGLGNNKNVKIPILVNCLSNKNVIEIGAGWSHSLALTDEGYVYAAGCGKFGELGLGESRNRYNYTWIRRLGNMNVRHIFAGGHHSWCIIDDKIPLRDKFIVPEPLEKPNYKMTKRKLTGLSDKNNLSFNEGDNRRNKASNTVDYKNRRNPYNDEDYFGNNRNNNSFDKKNTLNNKDLKRMIDDYNDEKDNSFNNIDNLIDCFDKSNTPESKKNKAKYNNKNNENINERENNNIKRNLNKMNFDNKNERNQRNQLSKYNNNINDSNDNDNNDNNNNNENFSDNSYENKINDIVNEDDIINNYNDKNNNKYFSDKNNNINDDEDNINNFNNKYNNLDDDNNDNVDNMDNQNYNSNEDYINNDDDNFIKDHNDNDKFDENDYIRNMIKRDNKDNDNRNKNNYNNNSKNNDFNNSKNKYNNKNNPNNPMDIKNNSYNNFNEQTGNKYNKDNDNTIKSNNNNNYNNSKNNINKDNNNNKNNMNNNYNNKNRDKDRYNQENDYNKNNNNNNINRNFDSYDSNNKNNYFNNNKYNSNNSDRDDNINNNYNNNDDNRDYNQNRKGGNNNNNRNYQNSSKNKPHIFNDSFSNKNNEALLYLDKVNKSKIQLQVVYSELSLSHRFIRFEISNTNKYYKLDFKSMNNMIKKFLSLDKGNISFQLQDDREVVKGDKKAINPMMDNLLREMRDKGLFNSGNRNKVNYTLAIVYDYNRNDKYKRLYNEFKENYNDKNISFINFKLIDENMILNEPEGLEAVLSKWAVDFFEQFKELFIYYVDDVDGNNFGIGDEKYNKPKFLEMRPKIFK